MCDAKAKQVDQLFCLFNFFMLILQMTIENIETKKFSISLFQLTWTCKMPQSRESSVLSVAAPGSC